MVDSRGRPRSFDKSTALEQALALFWQRGYLGTSYAELCSVTGLSKPSLYAALGNKEATFLAALEMYLSRYVQPGIKALNSESDARTAVHKLFTTTIDALCESSTPDGCFIATNVSCTDTAQIPDAVGQALRAALTETRVALEARLKRGQQDGQLPADSDLAALLNYLCVLLAGMPGLAKLGASKAELICTLDLAMQSWPNGNAPH